jgi:hypothetical protein
MGVSKANEVKKANQKITNWALNKDFAEKVRSKIVGNFHKLRSDRASREQKWLEFYRMWSVEHDDNQSYQGRANLYIPQVRKEVETMTRRLKKALFPEDYLDAEATKYEDSNAAETNKYVVRHFFDGPMNIKALADPWIKQNILYGTSPIKSYWSRREVEQVYRKKYFKELGPANFEAKFKVVKENTLLYNAPKARVCDIFQTYVSPQSAQLPTDIKEVFERQKVSLDDMKKKAADGAAVNIKFIEDLAKKEDYELAETQMRTASQGDSGSIVDLESLDLIEWWGELDLPDGRRLPCVVEIIQESIVTRIQQNPFWHQTPPYDFQRFIKPPPGEFYGRGIAEAIQFMQYQVNDMANQTMDSSTLALNNITIVNPAFAPNVDSFEIEPGAVWWADPNAIKQFVFPDLSDTGIKNLNLIRTIMTTMSDNSPQLPDPIAGKARSTGQAQLAIDEWQTDLFSFMQSIETEALVPFTSKTHSLIQQYVNDDLIIRVSGKYAETWIKKLVTPEDLAGRYDFTWKGAIQTQNNAIKVQQILQFIKVAQNLPPDSKVKVNWANLILKLFRDGLQFKDAHTIIETPDSNPSVPPSIENKMINMGGPVEVNPEDDDQLHVESHNKAMAESQDPYIKYVFSLHIAKHNAQIEQKRQMACAATNDDAANGAATTTGKRTARSTRSRRTQQPRRKPGANQRVNGLG